MATGGAVVNGPELVGGAKTLGDLAGCSGYAGWPPPGGSWYPLRMETEPVDPAALDAPPTTTTTAAPHGALLTVFLVVVIDLLGFAIVLPLLPRIAEAYLADQPKFVTGLTIGLLFS